MVLVYTRSRWRCRREGANCAPAQLVENNATEESAPSDRSSTVVSVILRNPAPSATTGSRTQNNVRCSKEAEDQRTTMSYRGSLVGSCSRTSSNSLLNDSARSALYIWDDEFEVHLPFGKRSSTGAEALSPARKRSCRVGSSALSSELSADVSRDPSEWSEMADCKLVGVKTMTEFDHLQVDIASLLTEMESFDEECSRYVYDRQISMVQLKDMYCSVGPISDPDMSLDGENDDSISSATDKLLMASSDSVSTCRPASILWCHSNKQVPFQDSYHSLISTDLGPSLSSTPDMQRSMLDSCISLGSNSSHVSLGAKSPTEMDLRPMPAVATLSVFSLVGHMSTAKLVSLVDFLRKRITDAAKLETVLYLSIKASLMWLLLPARGQWNLIQTSLYHMCLDKTGHLKAALSKSMEQFSFWFRTYRIHLNQVVGVSHLDHLEALERWTRRCCWLNTEQAVQEFEAQLEPFESAVKILIAWKAIVRHSSSFTAEEAGHWARTMQLEAVGVFVNLMQKPPEDFSYTEIVALGELLDTRLHIYRLDESVDNVLVKYPSSDEIHPDQQHCMDIVSVLPYSFMPVLCR